MLKKRGGNVQSQATVAHEAEWKPKWKILSALSGN